MSATSGKESSALASWMKGSPSEPEPEPEDEVDECEVDEVVIDGETYYKDADGTLYDPETSEEVGKLVDGEIVK